MADQYLAAAAVSARPKVSIGMPGLGEAPIRTTSSMPRHHSDTLGRHELYQSLGEGVGTR
jgi:hypothetical protein